MQGRVTRPRVVILAAVQVGADLLHRLRDCPNGAHTTLQQAWGVKKEEYKEDIKEIEADPMHRLPNSAYTMLQQTWAVFQQTWAY